MSINTVFNFTKRLSNLQGKLLYNHPCQELLRVKCFVTTAQHHPLKIAIVLILLELILSNALNQAFSRLPPDAYLCFKGFSIMPAILLKDPSTWKANVELFCRHYRQDIPNIAGLPAELHLYKECGMRRKRMREIFRKRLAAPLNTLNQLCF